MVSIDWNDVLAYKTIHITRITDKKLGLLHYTCLLFFILLYIVWELLLNQAYYEITKPTGFTNTWIGGTDDYLNAVNEDPSPEYCDNPETDYVWSENWVYENNTCRNLLPQELYIKGVNRFSFYTYTQTSFEERECENGTYSCDTKVLASPNAFFPHVEDLQLIFSHSFNTLWGYHKTNVETRILNSKGHKYYEFDSGSSVGLSLNQWINVAGFQLEDLNENSGGYGPPWPSFRLTGASVSLTFDYTNLHMFGSKPVCDLTVSLRKGAWGFLGANYRYTEYPNQYIVDHGSVVNFEFIYEGKMGQFSFSALVQSLIGGAVLIGVSTAVVDFLASYVLSTKDSFREVKYDRKSVV